MFLFIVLSIVLYQALKFLFQPYFLWRRQKALSGGVKAIKIVTKKSQTPFYQYKAKVTKQPDISLVVPSYNEEKRIPVMLNQTIPFFEKSNLTYEILVVNDGSQDKTSEVSLGYSTFQGQDIDLQVVEYDKNKGKGGAVRTGLLVANGQYVLMLDADGATEITEFNQVFDKLKSITNGMGLGLAAGSRHHLFSQGGAEDRKWYRNVLSKVSNFIVNVICGVKLKDTQCGFKLFTENTAKILARVQHLERWAFDVELFMIANQFKVPVQEIPVQWQDVEGSKLNAVEASITMARDFLLVRVLYTLGLWSFNDNIMEDKKKSKKD